MNNDLELAIYKFRGHAAKYGRPERYYAGEHDLSFATEKFQTAFGALFREFAMNLCPAIVDAVKDKLRVRGFSIAEVGGLATNFTDFTDGGGLGVGRPRAGEGALGVTGERPLTYVRGTDTGASDTELVRRLVGRIWRSNRMGVRAGEIHKEALRCGDAYAIVWPGADGRVGIHPQRARSVAVQYDAELPGRLLWAAKWWAEAGGRVRVNVYHADRIERWVAKAADSAAGGYLPEAKEFEVYRGDQSSPPATAGGTDRARVSFGTRGGGAGSPRAAMQARAPAFPGVIENPFGVVPVFHFANNSDVGGTGRSELAGAIPIQDGLNKSILDMLVAMEYSAFRQRWIAGLEAPLDPESGEPVAPYKTGAERLWVASDPATTFGDFNTTDLEQFLKVKDGFRIDMASVTGTPLHYFLQQVRGFASGEALKKNETRFLAKVRDRQEHFGGVWADLMSFAVRAVGGPDVELVTDWEDPAPMDEREMLENILLKKQIGISTEQALMEAGYGGEDAEEFSATNFTNCTNELVPAGD